MTIGAIKIIGQLFDTSEPEQTFVIKILQGSVVTQTVLGGRAIYFIVANFSVYV